MPNLFMVGGPNGAGKTTCAMRLLPDIIRCEEYVNADSIAVGISPFKPGSAALLAGRLMLERIHSLSMKGVDFAFETTMASRSFVPFLQSCKERGYQTNLLFFWLSNPDLALTRVAERVASGGHNVEEEVIIRRYWTGLSNFLSLYIPIADSWLCYDNSGRRPILIAEHLKDFSIRIYNEDLWRTILETGR